MAKLVKLDLGLVLTKIINKMNTIPSLIDGYLKNASVAGNKLTIVKNDGTTVEFTGGEGAKYTAGDNIQISRDNVISATDTKYSAGTNVSINEDNRISAVDTTYTAGDNVEISENNEISAVDTTYTSGDTDTVSVSIDEDNNITAE